MAGRIFGEQKPGENASKLMPTVVSDFLGGLLGIMPCNAVLNIKQYWLKSGKEIGPSTIIEIKSSADNTDLPPEDCPLVIGHGLSYSPTDDDISVYVAWLEVSGFLIHPVLIKAVTNKTKQIVGTPPNTSDLIPAKYIVAKGIYRTVTGTPSEYEKDAKYTLHTIQTPLVYKYQVYVVDENDWGFAYLPDYGMVKDKLDGCTNKRYWCHSAIMKYRL